MIGREYGILAHDVGQLPLAELPRRIAEKGFRYVQLALAKAITDVDTSLGKLSPGLGNRIAEEFERSGVRIPVLGCYIDMVNPDEDARRYGVERFKEHLRMARHFGAALVDTETGFVSAKYNKEQAWELMRRTVEELLEEAEKFGVFVGIEPCNGQIVSTAEEWQRLSEELPSRNLGAVLDPCNILNDGNFDRQDAIIRDAFERLGDRIVLGHAKDVGWGADGKLLQLGAGQGALNYPLFLELLNKHKPFVHVTMENLKPAEMVEALRFMKSMA
ncbi:sugar phosphate isomerase/epimerase family protein [Gorillibacterium sp. sgz5001074]|uniref:sugar phosphate isomerase/epimerase family protein n=1 Tax=Gorillibacterium sp. sgz5001074 TaxID=3446695 RepID=UPI003F663BB0